MKCSKCGNEIKQGDKFCTKCGKEVVIEQNIENKEVQRGKYTEKQDYSIMIFMLCIILIPQVLLMGFSGWSIFVILFTLVVFSITIITNLVFTCPNCNESITLNSRILNVVNQNKATCRCPKCGKELLFNTNEKTVNINKVIDNNNNNNAASGGTEEIERLYNLKSKGIITEEEFETKKQEILKKI